MANLEAQLKIAISQLRNNTLEARKQIYQETRIALRRGLETKKPQPAGEDVALELARLEWAIRNCEDLLFRARADAYLKKTSSSIETVKTRSMIRSEFLVDLALPTSKAGDFIDNLEKLFSENWVPKYGIRRARLIWHRQCFGLVVRYWFDLLLSTVERLKKIGFSF
ncbi:hypothetical protein [Rhizobium oryziradicis]|uniref:Uncharacterized protein n=1 Tax=Rhizobium oryziradicis TaxID=1867956 RepID=A0A1Q8ZRD2_9HYPH|nr:hypothetical protein [Rhizobium oryziradicis]OLP44616.1 hypothetical protein BJF95_08930 [Rhizobium oryziradicis]